MAEHKSIYRKVSLDRLSSPEQLDQKVTVVSPSGWIAIISLAVLVVAALFWGFLGSVSNRVSGGGVLMPREGVVTLISTTSGQITDVYVSAGEYVERGQIIASVSQDEITRQIQRVQDNLEALDAIYPRTLDLDILALNTELYREFSGLASQIRAARIQQEAQRAEAEHHENDFASQRTSLAHQIQRIEGQIASLERQISAHTRSLAYQREVDLENARAQDRQRFDIPEDDANLIQMRGQRDEFLLQRDYVREDLAALLAQQSILPPDDPNYDLLEAEIVGRRRQESSLDNQITSISSQISLQEYIFRGQQEAARAAPSVYEQVRNRPIYDPSLAQMHSQLDDLRQQLNQAQEQEAQGGSDTDFLWGGYNQTEGHIVSLTEQFANLQQIARQDLLRELEYLELRFEQYSVVTAGFSGTITSLAIYRYNFVQPGSVIGNIVRSVPEGNTYNVVLYVPVDRGMLIREGMNANISPTTVNREEHGHMLGVVTAVSEFAVTQEHMMSTLQNQQLVQTFGGQGAVIEVVVELERDDSTVSGFQWSTLRGAPFTIEPGTICIGEVTVYTQRPIDMVMPFLRRLIVGGDG